MVFELGSGAFPPVEYDAIFAAVEKNRAWYSSDEEYLSSNYDLGAADNSGYKPVGGFKGMLNRLSRSGYSPKYSGGSAEKLGTIASQISRMSGIVVFNSFPTIRLDDDEAQKRLNWLTSKLPEKLLKAQEQVSAIGGVYGYITWGYTNGGMQPSLNFINQDEVLPVFDVNGNLIEAVLWWKLDNPNPTSSFGAPKNEVYRHIEHHYLDEDGIGVIAHHLAYGDSSGITTMLPLTDHPDTAMLAELLNDNGVISTESHGLAVEYIPNASPQKELSEDPIGRHLGSSDYEGVYSTMQIANRALTQLDRELVVSRARIVVNAEAMGDNGGLRGKGVGFDINQDIWLNPNTEVYPLRSEKVNNGVNAGSSNKPPVELIQPELRGDDYISIYNECFKSAIQAAGFSLATFSLGEGTAITATEVKSREKNTYAKRNAANNTWKPRLEYLLYKMLLIDEIICDSGITAQQPVVVFAEGVEKSLKEDADTLVILLTAGLISKESAVEYWMTNQGKSEGQIQSEKDRIKAELEAESQVADVASVEITNDNADQVRESGDSRRAAIVSKNKLDAADDAMFNEDGKYSNIKK